MLRPKLAVGVVDRGNITEHSVCLYIIEENLLLQVEQDAHEELQCNKNYRVRIGLHIVYSEMKAYLSVNFTLSYPKVLITGYTHINNDF